MKHLESELQRMCIRWFRYQYRCIARLLFAVPNGGARNRVEAAIMKGEGVTAGVSDVILLYSNGEYSSLCIEFKTEKGRQTALQKEWQKLAEMYGNRYEICRTFDEFKSLIECYMSGKKI